jgi:Ni/Co efflux regulator RcnB
MIISNLSMKAMLALAFAGMLAIGPALAKSDKDDHPGKGKGHSQKGERHEAGGKAAGGHGGPVGKINHFEDRHRVVVTNYYSEQFRAGRCPPGLAKKHNGCMPPGQAKKWNIGQPLPRGVTYYAVPQSLVVQFGPPPSGCRYVRVASDILVVSISTKIVVDAIVI